jgi:hypothetical protein
MQFEIDVMLDYQLAEPADVLLQIEVAQMADQRLIGDLLTISSPEPLRPVRHWPTHMGACRRHLSRDL